jgi:hypothetical protein
MRSENDIFLQDGGFIFMCVPYFASLLWLSKSVESCINNLS